ncbi:MAG: ribbon-helix-helix domain-containing protein [bacterium]
MGNTKKIAISLPAELVKKVEKIRKQTGESRSAVIRRSIEYAMERQAMDALVVQYLEGYLKYPETGEEKNIVKATYVKSLDEGPWE